MNDVIWVGDFGFSAIMLLIIIWNLVLTKYVIKLNKKQKIKEKKNKSVILSNDCGL